MAAKTFDPTANPFELLANAENQSIVAPERRKKAAANKAAVEEPVGAVPTPAAKAQARAAKEAAKTTKDGSPADNQGKQEPAKKKLTREQFEEEKRKGNNLLGDAPAGSSDVSTSSARPPRARGEGGVAGRGRGGGRGRGDGQGRGRGRGRGDGQGRGSDDKAGGGRGDKDKDHHYQPPVHGRDYDKKSAAKTSKNAPFKKGGSGSGGNYGTTQDDLAGQTGVDNVDQPTDDADKDNKDTKDKKNKKNDGEESSEEDNGVLFAEYQKKKAELDAALLAKIGGTAAPRKVEGSLAGTVTKVDVEKKPEEKKEKPKVEEKVGGMKIANVEDFFHVRAAPVIRGERGRGRGRGGRGRGRGRGDSENATEAGTVEGEQTSETDQSANQSNQQQGSRGRGGRGGDSNRGQGRGGRGQGRGDRGQGRGGRGQGRGDSNGRGQGSGRGGRGGRRPNLDTSNTRHFPDLGSN